MRFVDLCVRHELAGWHGDYIAANKLFDEIDEICNTIRKEGLRADFEEFFLHPSPTVRLKAAFNYFAIDPDISSVVLEKIIAYAGPIALSAEMLLEEIRAGRIVPP